MDKFFKGQVLNAKKEEGEMKKISIVVAFLMLAATTLLIPQEGKCYVETVWSYGSNGVISSVISTDRATGLKKTETFYDNVGLRDYSLSYGNTNDSAAFRTDFAYNQYGKLIYSDYTSVKDNATKLRTFYDASGQELLTVDLNVVQNYALFLGDPNGNSNAPTNDWELNAQTDAGAAVMAALAQLGALSGFDIRCANSDTHSGFNLASFLNSPMIVSVNADSNGDGIMDTTYGFTKPRDGGGTQPAFTSNGHAYKTQDGTWVNDTLYCYSIKKTDTSGKVTMDRTELRDPSRFHTDGTWDPSITMQGILGRDANGAFFITDANGNRHNLDVQDANLANKLAQNIGKSVSVTGDHADNDPGANTIFLQEFNAV